MERGRKRTIILDWVFKLSTSSLKTLDKWESEFRQSNVLMMCNFHENYQEYEHAPRIVRCCAVTATKIFRIIHVKSDIYTNFISLFRILNKKIRFLKLTFVEEKDLKRRFKKFVFLPSLALPLASAIKWGCSDTWTSKTKRKRKDYV